MEERNCRNFDHPDSLDTALLVEHIKLLKELKPVNIPKYDFGTHGRLNSLESLYPKAVVIVEGILIFADKNLADLFDMKVFVDMSADIRSLRRLQRDITERKRSMESVIEQYMSTVKPMHDQFVEPSKASADFVVPGVANEVSVNLIGKHVMQILQQKD